MVDSIDLSTLDLTAEFAAEEELSQIASSHHGDYDDDDTQHSNEIETFDNFELSFFSQRSQSPSQLSTHSSQSQHKQCTNCGAQNTLQLDDNTGHKICTNCSHIVQDYENMQSADVFADEDDDQIAEQQQDILKEHQKNKYQPLNKDIIHFQDQYSELVLNAFQCVLQSQLSVLIHEYNVKPHLYTIVGQIWFRFLNKIWIQKGFGSKDNAQSQWIWNKNQCKLWQNNDFKEQWTQPKVSVIDVFMTTEDDTDTTSSDDDNDDALSTDSQDSIDLHSLLSDASAMSISSQTSIPQSKSVNKKRYRKRILTEKEKRKLDKEMKLKRKQCLPQQRTRFTERITQRNPFEWKRVEQKYDSRNERTKYDEYLYEAGEINLELSLVLLYIGLRICGEILTMNDVINGAQKGIIPYLRAFESLPLRFRVNDSKQRRKLYGSDANYVSFRKFFIRNEMKYEIKQFYCIYHRLIDDLDLMDKIVPFNTKLMIIKYLRDLNIPLALYSIVEIFLEKYKAFWSIFCVSNDFIDNKWKELAEYESRFVHYTNNSKLKDTFDISMKMIFTNGIDENDYKHLTPVTIMTLIVIAVLSVYRFDKTLKHKLNEHPLFSTLPPLSLWFDFSLKYKYMDCNLLCDVPKMFGYDTMNKENDNISWIFGLTKDFILRHYAVKPHCTLIHKFMENKAKAISKKYKNINKEKKDKKSASLNEYKSFNSLYIKEKEKGKVLEYNGFDSNYSFLYVELMLLCSSRIGIKLNDLQQRLQRVLTKLKIVFEYNEIISNQIPPISIPLNRLITKQCTFCGVRISVNKMVQCYANYCENKICIKCLILLIKDVDIVNELLMKQNCGILKAQNWKCFECESGVKKERKKVKSKVYIRKIGSSSSFECKYCQRKFSRKYNMNVHIANVHDHSLRRFQCNKCLQRFATGTLQKRHTLKCQN